MGPVRSSCALACALAAASLSGCATYSYIDKAGARHVIGLVDMTIKPAGDDKTLAGDVVRLESFGVLAADTAQGSTFALGYSSQTTSAIRNNALVLGNPNKAVRTIFEGEKPCPCKPDASSPPQSSPPVH